MLVACIQSIWRIVQYTLSRDPKGSEQQCEEFLNSDRRRSFRDAASFLIVDRQSILTRAAIAAIERRGGLNGRNQSSEFAEWGQRH